MSRLRVSSFGIRGFIGESLSPRVAMDFAAAFGSFNRGGTILVGRDTRFSSPMIHAAVISALMSTGCQVLDMGVCPMPMVQYTVSRLKASGGLCITGGHNTSGWNAVMLIGPDGAMLNPVGGETVLDVFHSGDFKKVDWQHVGEVERLKGYAAPYFESIEEVVDLESIRRAELTVVIDPVGGGGCPFLEEFAMHLGCHLVPINAQPSGYLAREPEPRPRSASQMASIMTHVGGHAGFLLSSDMSRLSMVTETGEPASEEATFSVIADHVLSARSGPVVTNCCTTRTIDDIANRFQVPLIKVPVGQAYVAASIMDEQARLGGEGSGSVLLPDFSLASDGFLMMALILETMVQREEPVSRCLNDLPRYAIVKRVVPCSSRHLYRVLDATKGWLSDLAGREPNTTDGLRADLEDGWVHVRASRTEQMIRVISESDSLLMAQDRADKAVRILEGAV